jgi:hypothetical protein
MNKVARACFVAIVAALALAQTNTPTLQVIPFVTALGRATDTELDISIPASAPATAKASIYVPTGYTANLTQAAGTKIADVLALVDARGTSLPLQGQVIADTPAKYASDPRAQACAPGTHAAVWVIQLQLQAQTLNVPMFVDPTSGAEAALGSYKIQVCFASPDVPEAQGGAPFGAKVVEADVDFTSAFTNPASAAIYVWRALVTPYVAGTGTPNAAGTYELRSDAFLPVRFTLKARWDVKKRVAVITGTVAVPGATVVRVLILGRPSATSSSISRVGTAKVTKGKFTLRKRLTKKTFLTGFVQPTLASCDTSLPTPGPAGCATETTAPLISPTVVVTPRKK